MKIDFLCLNIPKPFMHSNIAGTYNRSYGLYALNVILSVTLTGSSKCLQKDLLIQLSDLIYLMLNIDLK